MLDFVRWMGLPWEAAFLLSMALLLLGMAIYVWIVWQARRHPVQAKVWGNRASWTACGILILHLWSAYPELSSIYVVLPVAIGVGMVLLGMYVGRRRESRENAATILPAEVEEVLAKVDDAPVKSQV